MTMIVKELKCVLNSVDEDYEVSFKVGDTMFRQSDIIKAPVNGSYSLLDVMHPSSVNIDDTN